MRPPDVSPPGYDEDRDPPTGPVYCRLIWAADEALDTGGAVEVPGTDLVVLSDMFLAEFVANGHEFPPAVRFTRDDGRTAYACRWHPS